MVSLQGSDLGKTVYPYDSVDAVLPPRFQTTANSVQDLTVSPVNNVYDLHGSPTEADLVVFFNGNQFMVVSELLQAFRQQQPSIKHIFYETLPPGVLVQQVKDRPLRIGNLVLTLRPDVITAGADEMRQLTEAKLVQRHVVYAENALAILVAAGNPLHIHGLADLARPEVRVAMPDPATEGVGRLIVKAYEQTGGSDLVAAIMEQKVANGSTRLTRIHHRETALDILAGEANAGPLWISEALFQQRLGNAFELIPIADEFNQRGQYMAGTLAQAPHAEAASALLDFMQTPVAQGIYSKYGFRIPS